jgi:O-antigen ligase
MAREPPLQRDEPADASLVLARTLRAPAPSPYREIAAAALIGWCATSLASSHFSTHWEGRLIFFWLGAMLGGQESPKAVKRNGPRPT